MTTAPEPVDDSYPASWRPREARERLDRTEMELAAGAMSDDQWAEFVSRARGGQN